MTGSAQVVETHECRGMASADTCQTSCDPLQYVVKGLPPFVGSMFGLDPAGHQAGSYLSWRPYLFKGTGVSSLRSAEYGVIPSASSTGSSVHSGSTRCPAVNSTCWLFIHRALRMSVAQVPLRAGFARVSPASCTCRLSASSQRVAALRQHHVYAAEVCHLD